MLTASHGLSAVAALNAATFLAAAGLIALVRPRVVLHKHLRGDHVRGRFWADLTGGLVRPRLLIGVGIVAIGVGDLVIFNYPHWYRGIWPALALMAAVGMVAGGIWVLVALRTAVSGVTPATHRMPATAGRTG